jgi:hypothetical protein
MAAEPAYQPPSQSGGISDSVTELIDDVQRLVQLEIELAQQEIQELLWRNVIAIGLIAVAALGGLFALIFLQVTLVEAIPTPPWLNALVLTIIWIAVATVLFLVGRSRIKIAPPEKTIQSIKDDLEWVKTQIKQVTR